MAKEKRKSVFNVAVIGLSGTEQVKQKIVFMNLYFNWFCSVLV